MPLTSSPLQRPDRVFDKTYEPVVVAMDQLHQAPPSGDTPPGIHPAEAALATLYRTLQEPEFCGSSYVSSANRLLLLSLALTLRAQDILETGTNTGMTTLAFALTGARVVSLDHGNADDPGIAPLAAKRLAPFANVHLVQEDALFYLTTCPAERFDLIFLDDGHWPGYTALELRQIGRVLRPGGICLFHDTHSCHLWEVIEEMIPSTWQRFNVPSWQGDPGYHGMAELVGQDFGLGMIRKPTTTRVNPMLTYEALPVASPHGRKGDYSITVDTTTPEGTMLRICNTDTDAVAAEYVGLLEVWRTQPHQLNPDVVAMIHAFLEGWGQFCAARASEAMRRKFERVAPVRQEMPHGD